MVGTGTLCGMPLRAETVPVPDDPAHPHPWLGAVVEVERAHHQQLFGHDDLVDPVESVATAYTWQDTSRRVRLVALDGDAVVGAAHTWMPLRDNRTLGYFLANYRPGSEESAVYDVLWAAAEPLLAAAERTSIHCWASHPPVVAGERQVEPRSGAGALAEDERARWLAAHGFVLEQVERYSMLTVDGQAQERARQVLGRRPGDGTDDLLRTWVGATPAELRPGMAALRSRMSVDTPAADLDHEEEVWDVEQVVQRDHRMDAAGRDVVTTVALHDGEPVAYTEISVPRGRPVAAFQDDTLVHGEHRGRRLGAAVKAANLLALHTHAPTVERIHTWNAEENAHMLAINDELGFRAAGVQGGWQLRR